MTRRWIADRSNVDTYLSGFADELAELSCQSVVEWSFENTMDLSGLVMLVWFHIYENSCRGFYCGHDTFAYHEAGDLKLTRIIVPL